MNERYIRTHDIVGRYLLKQLSDEEKDEFERYYFEHPEILEELELERTLRDAFRDSPELGLSPEPRPSIFRRALAIVTMPAWSLGATAVAAALALVFIGSVAGRGGPSPIIESAKLGGERGASGSGPTLHLAGEGVVSLNIDLRDLDPQTTTAQLEREGARVAELPVAAPDADRIAHVVVPSKGLKAGSYAVVLKDRSGRQYSYEFQVER